MCGVSYFREYMQFMHTYVKIWHNCMHLLKSIACVNVLRNFLTCLNQNINQSKYKSIIMLSNNRI